MNRFVRRFGAAAVLALVSGVVVASSAAASDDELFDGILGDDTPGETVTDESGDSSDEQSPTDDSVIEELQPEGPPGPVGYTGVPTYEAVWAPGEIVPSQVKILKDDENVELVTFTPEGGSSLMALLVIDSADAATEYRFENAVPADHTAFVHADGSVRFIDADGSEAGGIAAPWAMDADGNEVRTSYTLDDTTLVQAVQHQGATYPVIADPWWSPIAHVATIVSGAVALGCAPVAFCPASVTIGAGVLTVAGVGLAVYSLMPKSGNPDSPRGRGPTSTCNVRIKTSC